MRVRTCYNALSTASPVVLQGAHEGGEAINGDGAETGVDNCLADEANGGDSHRREDSAH